MNDVINQKGEVPFTQVSNKVIRDDDLGAIALAIYTYIRSHNLAVYKIYKKNVQKRFSELSRGAFDRGWKELVTKGWLLSKRVKDDKGKFTQWQHDIYLDNPNIELNMSNGKVIADIPNMVSRATEKPADIPIADSRLVVGLKNTNSKNNKNIKNIVSNETLNDFELLWSCALDVYKKYGFRVGNKQPALKAFKSCIKLDVTYLKTQLCNQINAKGAIQEKTGYVDNPRNLSTWIRAEGWSEGIDDIKCYEKTAHKRSGAALAHVIDEVSGTEAWGVSENGEF